MDDTAKKPGAAQDGAGKQATRQASAGRHVSDPREITAMVLARIHMVNTKKDELTIAIKSLSDLTQQLAKAYGEQTSAAQGLLQRARALEAAGNGLTGPPTADGNTPPADGQGPRLQ